MGFWSGLAKGIGTGLQFVPIPGAGMAGKALSYAAKAAPIVAGMAGDRAAGHQAAASQQLNFDALNLKRAGMQNENEQTDFKNRMLLNQMQMNRSARANHPRANVVHFFDPSTMPALPSAPKFSSLPGVAPPPQSGFMDKLLSAAGPATAFAGLFQKPINVGQVPGGADMYPHFGQQGALSPGQLPGQLPPFDPNAPLPLDPRRLPGQLPGMA